MATVENLPSQTTERPIGFGRLKRKEDARFIRGQGTYLDDIRLPGMVYGALLRSRTRTRIVSIDTSRSRIRTSPRSSPPRTSRRSGSRGCRRSPTTQAVLAGDKVRFQGQEVAFVIATDEYSANDALQLIDVEYEPLPAVVNARKALDPDAPLIRDDKSGQATTSRARPGRPATRRRRTAPSPRPTRRLARHHLPALPPGPARDVRDHRRLQPGDRPARHLQRQPGAARAPHGLRARRRARRAHDPDPLPGHRRRLRQQGSRLPGLRVRDRRLDRGRRAGQVGREPHREPVSTGFARDYVMHAEMCSKDGKDHRPARRRDRRPRRLRLDRAADEVPGRVLPHRLRLLRPRGVARQGEGRLHEQGAGRRRLPVLVPDHRGRLPGRADGRRARARDEGRSRSSCA